MNEQKKIKIVAEIETSLGNMDKTINKLEQGLKKQKFDLSKNSGLTKLIQQYKEAKEEFDSFSTDGFIDSANVKKAAQAGEKVSKIYRQIHQTFQKIRESDGEAFKTLFPDKFSTQVKQGTKAINTFFSDLAKKQNKDTALENAEKDLERLNTQLTILKTKRVKIEVDADIQTAEKKLDELQKKREQLIKDFEKRITPEDVYDESGKKLDKKVIEANIESKKSALASLTEKGKGLTKGSLTKKDEQEIQDLKEQIEDSENQHREKVLKGTIKKYQDELQKRDVALETGSPDKGRARRDFGNLTREEIESRLVKSERELKEIEEERVEARKKITEIEKRPAKRFQQSKQKNEREKKQAQAELEAAEKELKAYEELEKKQAELVQTRKQDFTEGKESAISTEEERKQLQELDAQIQQTSQNIKDFKEEKTFSTQQEKDDAISRKESSIRNKELDIAEIRRRIADLTQLTDIDEIFKTLESFNINTEGIEKTEEGLRKIRDSLNSMDENTITSIRSALNDLGIEGEEAEEVIKELAHGLNLVGNTDEEIRRAEQEIENLKDQVKYFFSLSNAIDLFKRTVSSAVDTVKELDEIMTETAVVTDFTIGDMWEKLPEYAEQASNLGASIGELYGATTLYYQQGLNSAQAMDVGIETMKMARIANIDAAEATKAMTAALRGFNMEINEQSATRINDVYSELAAITAADTNQIATAMGKTASIAASANMEFETTAALLAQIIETTQEAPETAGTAMKTIIARFTEVKELFDEGLLTGEDEEGEEININKIDVALKKVGISLKDFLNGSKGIDDIFLELASKWDTLDLATQRYIATTAAGSRQQSRFLAMMSNYDRTMELVTAANNSAGASQKQYEKTLESLQAKLQQLKNAWDQFVMGLANDSLIKAGVDALTWILESINKLIDGFSGNNGLSKSLITLMTVITVLKSGGRIFNKIFDSEGVKNFIGTVRQIPNEAKKAGQEAGQGLRQGISQGLNSTATEASQIGLKAGQNYKAGFEAGLNGDSLDIWDEDLYKDQDIDKPSLSEKGKSEQIPENQNKQANQLQKFWKETDEQGFQAASAITMLSGTLLNLLGSAAKAGDEMNAFGTGLQWAGTAATVAGSAIGLLAPFLAKTTLTLSTLAPWILGVVAAVGFLTGAFQAIYNNSPEGKLEAAANAANEVAQAAEGAAQAYEHLNNSLNSISEKQDSLKNLAQGTSEWKEAVYELNNEVLDLIEKYPELGNFVDSSKGFLRFDKDKTVEIDGKEETVDTILQKYETNKVKAQSAKAAADIQQQYAQQNLDFDQLADTAKVTFKLESDFSDNATLAYNQEQTDELARKLARGEYYDSNGEVLDEFAYLGNIGSEAWNALRDYGKGLLASDAAVEAFTDSLLSNALMIADVSEEQKDNMMNFLSSEQIDQIRQSQEKDIIDDGISEEEKRTYARVMGYDYDSKKDKFYDASGTEKNISDESIAAQLAGIKTQEDLTSRMNKLNEVLNNSTTKGTEMGQIFENITSQAEGAGLTFEQLGKIDEAAIINFYNSFTDEDGNNKLDDVYGSFDEFKTYIDNATLLAQKREKDINEKGEKFFGYSEMFKNIDIDTGSASKIVDNLYQVLLESGYGTTRELWAGLSEGLSGDEAQKFADALDMIDWTDTDSIKQLSEYLVELDFTELDPTKIEQIENEIISAMNAVSKFNLDSFKEKLKSTEELIEDISDREDTERTYSEEEYKLAVEADETLSSKFVQTGLDEFVYIGESNEGLIEALNNNTATILQEQSEKVKEAAEQSNKWEKLQKEDEVSYNQLRDIALAETTEEGASLVAQMTPTKIEKVLSQFGINGWDLDNPEKYSDEVIYDIIKKEYEEYGSAQAQKTNQANWESWMQSMPSLYYSSMTGQEILSQKGTFQAEGQKALTEEEDDAARIAALEAKLVQIEGGRTEADSMLKNDEWREHEALVKASITDAADYEKKVSKLADTIADNADALKDSNKESKQYEKALDKITDAAKEAFGDNITKEFVEENLELFKKFAEGSEGSADDIREAILQTYEDTEVEGQNVFGDIQKAAEGLDGLNFDIYGHADASQIFSELAAVMGDAKAAAEVIRQLGFSVSWVPDGTTEMITPDGSVQIPNYRTIVTDTAGNVESARRGGGGGGGGGGGKWENPYDKLYNITENINRTLREREKLERRYQAILDKRVTSAQALRENSLAELASLKEQAEYQKQMIAGREEMLREHLAENEELSEYGTYDFENQMIVIDWEAIDAVDSTKEGEKIEEYIGKLEELRDSIQDAEDGLADIEDQIQEINERGKDEYFELEERIKDAIIETRQKEINTMEEINESINETNSKLLDAIQQSIDKIRQDRENAETEEDLAEKQRQLAYLQQDTSGANAMEILALQEEIRQGQQDYTDTLIDQKISELQQQNDEAAEQREKQIAILQSQLDHYIESGNIWRDVYDLMGSGLDKEHGLIRGSKLEEILKDGENWSGMSTLGQMTWLEELEDIAAQALNYLKLGRQLENLDMSGQTIEFTTADGQTLTGKVDKDGNVTVDGYTYEGIYQNWDGSYLTDENYQEPKDQDSTTPETPETPKEEEQEEKKTYWKADYSVRGEKKTVWGYSSKSDAEKAARSAIYSYFKNKGYVGGTLEEAAGWAYQTIKAQMYKYKTGGLADFTGPAWLDGTKSKPELVLNARDTQNFIQLKDILSSLMSRNFPNSHTSTENNGDITYDIDINVESIGNDYDIEQVASKIKSLINEDARYRNNNAVSLKR